LAPKNPEPSKDETKESPRAKEPGNQGGDDVAPKGQSQGGLFIRQLQDALKDDAKTKNLEKDSGYTKGQIEQFIRDYKKTQSGPAGPGRELEVKPGEQTPAQKPSANLPGLDSKTRFSSTNLRNRGTMPQDQVRGNIEGVRLEPPPELRGRWEGYTRKLAKVASPKRAPAPK
jgi:hypothetical protein